MSLSRMTVCFVFLGLFTAFGVSAYAAEFSPTLDYELSQAPSGAYVSAIVILPSPVDIRALDMRLHEQHATKAERHREIIRALQYNADQTQPAYRAELDDAQVANEVVGYTAYWIENLFVIQATKDYIESLRSRGDIVSVSENFHAELMDPVSASRPHDNPLDSRLVPPGITAIGARRVVEELGITGQGVLVGICDTGVNGLHEALSSRWRGNFAPWYHCWKDDLGTGTQSPNDGYGHGTHVMGTMCGRAYNTQGYDTLWIGCAPDARWIATNAINQGVGGGFDNDIISDYQWFADPDSNINTTDDVPDVIQNSWGVGAVTGYPQCYNMWNTVILNCEAAGPVITWSAGNEGSQGLRSPAIYSINAYQIFSVGAVDATNYGPPYPIASFSSLGPSNCPPYNPDNIKPEIAAPGVDIYSSLAGSLGGPYGNLSGTSMAGPHIAGVVALMREACPDCDYITIKQSLMDNAIDYGPAGQDNTYGWGFVDGYNSVLSVMGNRGRVTGVIRDAATLNPLEATVQVVGGTQSTVSGPSGVYWLNLPSDSVYTLNYSLYGYYSQDLPVTVLTGDTTVQNVDLVARPVVTIFTEDFESGAPGWTHSTPGGQWIDQWHLSTEMAHGGTTSYKCGDTGTGTYGNLNDARLTSPVISNLPAEATLSFYMGIQSELSGAYPDSAYDGGVLEISANGGAFAEVTPLGGYPKTFRYQSGGGNPATGPMPGLPCWADTLPPSWALEQVDLSAFAGQNIQFRYRFGSDQGLGREGWYVDDVALTAFGSLVDPTGLALGVSGTDLVLHWDADVNPAYRIYSDTTPDGAFSTLEGSTTGTSFTIPGGAADPLKFYVIRGWDGN